jgi:hypothetical protein
MLTDPTMSMRIDAALLVDYHWYVATIVTGDSHDRPHVPYHGKNSREICD